MKQGLCKDNHKEIRPPTLFASEDGVLDTVGVLCSVSHNCHWVYSKSK
jgi:hypothetical protein